LWVGCHDPRLTVARTEPVWPKAATPLERLADLLELVVETLQNAGHAVEGATDPAAVERALADPYDVIVTDYGIAGLPADELLARPGTAAPATRSSSCRGPGWPRRDRRPASWRSSGSRSG
jgi:hypothetical protein